MGLFNAIFGNKRADELEKELYEKNNQLAYLSKHNK